MCFEVVVEENARISMHSTERTFSAKHMWNIRLGTERPTHKQQFVA